MRLKPQLHWVWSSLHPRRWPVLIAITGLCLAVGENYPFSNFPMYSAFAKNSYYLYLADAAGRPLPTTRFGVTTSRLKKIFELKRRALFRVKAGATKPEPAAVDRAAGAALLQYLEMLPAVRSQKSSLLRGLQVRRVGIFWKAASLRTDTQTLAQHP